MSTQKTTVAVRSLLTWSCIEPWGTEGSTPRVSRALTDTLDINIILMSRRSSHPPTIPLPLTHTHTFTFTKST